VRFNDTQGQRQTICKSYSIFKIFDRGRISGWILLHTIMKNASPDLHPRFIFLIEYLTGRTPSVLLWMFGKLFLYIVPIMRNGLTLQKNSNSLLFFSQFRQPWLKAEGSEMKRRRLGTSSRGTGSRTVASAASPTPGSSFLRTFKTKQCLLEVHGFLQRKLNIVFYNSTFTGVEWLQPLRGVLYCVRHVK
jgi:hypothetical protein